MPDQKGSFRTEKKHPVCKYKKMEEAKSTNPTPEGICKPESWPHHLWNSFSWFQKPQTFIAEAAFTASLKHKKLSTNYQSDKEIDWQGPCK